MAGRCLIAFMAMASCLSVIVSGHGGLPEEVFELDVASKLRVDRNSTARASSDFGRIVAAAPEAVLHPAMPADIAELVRFSASSPSPFPVAPRGQGHSARGQSLAPGGVVVDMRALAAEGSGRRGGRVNVSVGGAAPYVDAGGEQLWANVLRATLKHGLSPRVWTDYLHITARIGLELAPKRVRWVRLAYSDVVTFTRDLELLISKRSSEAGFDYVEGQVQLNRTLFEGPKSTLFFSGTDIGRLAELTSKSVQE
ncbi:hypothetical protein E2562_023418 [Oryza meyeriana var. granulata]|uniref:Cytokinin dehydrogenase 1 FAD/cytokinin binding domain-containing protein n=1 Tax=Oryza meyeriana var. granulata TaxID=110450 RepID=A0A6G1FBE7_9ORYZ|nr:hypothetical protein E2562_023418 [Oryza meyeriana var. granulata]